MSVMIGIDPHKGSHTAVVVDLDEVVIDQIRVKTTANQLGQLREWASGYADRCWAVESARGMGHLVSQQLVAVGERVVDVPPMMASRVRVLGSGKSQKTDPNDARSVAIAALRHPGLTMVRADDHTRVLGLLAKRHRDLARNKNKAACRLHALLTELTAGGLASEMTVNKANLLLERVDVTEAVTRQRVMIAAELVDDISRLETQMRTSKQRIRIAVAASGTSLCDIRGIGPIGAAMILSSVGDIARFPTAGHFASYNATAPIEASSGNKRRHRLNPRGNRKLNPRCDREMMSEPMTVVEWLLDSDPAIRWQVMRDLTGEPMDVVIAERARVGVEGWGAQLLALQDGDGRWDGGTYRPRWIDESKPFFDAWTATHFSLQLLRDFGLDADSPEARRALSLVRENVRWDVNDALYFEGETEPCINGMALAIGAYFGEAVDGIVGRLLSEQLDDGGWNCWAEYGATVSSFHTTICVLEGLLTWERAGGSSGEVVAARSRSEEYLLERGLFRARSTRQIIDPRFTMFSFPARWYYDVLRGLDYFRSTGAGLDDRCAEAIDLVVSKRDVAGRWPLENTHQGPTHFEMEGPDGFPSRWNTLRAMRVLDWAGSG